MDSSNTTTQNVAIVTDGGSFTIAPGSIPVYPGDKISFQNLTAVTATVILPDERVFNKTMLTIDPGKKADLIVPTKFDRYGSYPFAVYFRDRREFAHASMPIIIIYPRD